jgi:DNA polymerase III delta prime subunit
MLEKYKPTKFSEIIGNKTAIQTLGRWLLTWSASSACALVSGPCGIGKTLSIELLIKQPEYNVMEVNTDDERNESFITQKVAPFVKTIKNVWGKSNILVVNDVDVSNDNGFIGALCKCVKETKIPIILTCNDRYEPKIKPLAALCTDIKFFKPTSAEICKYITEIVKKELNTTRLTTHQNQLIQTATETAEGDVRNAIMSAEFSLITVPPAKSKSSQQQQQQQPKGKKDTHKTNIFEVTTDFMSQLTDFVDKVDLFHMENDLMPLMVHENYPLNIMRTKTKLEELYHLSFASAAMSDYDLLPYECEDISIIRATNVCHPKKINFTGYLGKMSSKTKKTNITTNIEANLQIRVGHFRLDYMSYMLMILYNQINTPTTFVDKCVSYGFTKEDIQDNLSVILIAEGSYSKCDYSSVDKKVKASITKLFSKESPPPAKTTKTKTKSTKEKKQPISKAATPTTTPTPEPIPSAIQPPLNPPEEKTKPTSTVVRKRNPKTVSTELSTPQPEKPTSTIVRRKKTTT